MFYTTMAALYRILTVVLPSTLLLSYVSAYIGERNLIKTLLSEENYNINERPATGPDEPVTVKMILTLHKLIELNGRSQVLTTSVWKRLEWVDYRLSWDPDEYNGTKQLRIAGTDVWLPDMTLYDDVAAEHDNRRDYFSAQIDYEGNIVWAEPALLTSHCDLNVSAFPFDRQACTLKFGSWTSDATKIFISNESIIDITEYNPNGEWNMVRSEARHHSRKYNCCEHPFHDVTYCLVLERRPLYYVFNLVLPCVFITATTVLVFYLPPESGEKVSLSVTVLLATTVFLLLVAESMPPQSEVIPLISQYFAATVILMALSTVLTVLVTNLQYRGTFHDRVPNWLWAIISFLATLVFMKKVVQRQRKDVPEARKYPIEDSPIFKREKKDSSMRSTGTYRLRADPLDNGSSPVVTDSEHQMSQLNSAPAHACHRCNEKQSFHGNSTDQLLEKILNCLEDSAESRREDRISEKTRSDWVIVSAVVDRVILLVFFVVTVLVTGLILGLRPRDTGPTDALCEQA